LTMTKQFNRSLSVDLDIAVRDVFISALKFSHFVLIKKEYRLFPGNINHFRLVIYTVMYIIPRRSQIRFCAPKMINALITNVAVFKSKLNSHSAMCDGVQVKNVDAVVGLARMSRPFGVYRLTDPIPTLLRSV